MRAVILPCIIVLFCLNSACFACIVEDAYSGSISGSHRNTYDSFSHCWIIPVPENTYVKIQIKDLVFNKDCSNVHLKIFAEDQDNPNTFCELFLNQVILTALSNVTILYEHSGQADRYRKSSFSLHYSKESIICTRPDHFRCSDHHCIHKNQVCDRIDDCGDSSDETSCERGIVSVEGSNIIQAIAFKWLMERAVSPGWGKDTHRAITALYLTHEDFGIDGSIFEKELKKELMIKQLELRALLALLRNSSEPVSVSELSMFVNALMVTCHNPRQFHGYDLIKILYERESTMEAPCPGVYLTLCNAGWILSQSDASKLFTLLQKKSKYPFFTDIQAMTIMALSCIKYKYEEYEILFNDSSIFEETVDYFIESQLPDGSFGNVYTTALITQALISSGQENNMQWDISSTVKYFKHYFTSASSVDFLSVYLALPIFSSRSLVDVGNVNCANSYRKLEDTDISDVIERLDEKVFIQYSLYIGDEREIIHTIFLKMPKNSSAYYLMRVAQATDAKYKFFHKFTFGGMYVYQIAGIANDPEAGKFWLLNTEDKELKILRSHAESPDTLVLKDGDHLVMWYKTARL